MTPLGKDRRMLSRAATEATEGVEAAELAAAAPGAEVTAAGALVEEATGRAFPVVAVRALAVREMDGSEAAR